MRGDGGGPGDGEDFSLPEAGGAIDEARLDVPNCPSCLQRMEVGETADGGLFWECPSCGQAKVG